EKAGWQNGLTLICGVDEAGRGPLAGPVVAAAVVLDPNNPIEGLWDSKKLTEQKREQLFIEIQEKALYWSVAQVDETEIDQINILQATFRAMEKAVENLGITPELVMIDGNKKPNIDGNVITIVKGDAKSATIGAASIVAKVTRDHIMIAYAEQYSEYSFEKHKGYPTKAHYEAIKANGILPIHRKSFLKNLASK
ncbi:MAG: ribonuclease HII, partial [Oscillospiraceae bacterium]